MHRRSRHLNPAQAGAQIALDARFITGQADNTTLQTWPSRAVASITASQSTSAQRPTYRNPSINGQPALVFDGSDDNYDLSASALSLTNGAASITALILCQNTSVTDAIEYAFFTSSGSSATANRFSARLVDTSIQRVTGSFRSVDGDTNVVTSNAGSPTNPCIVRIASDYPSSTSSSGMNGGTATTVSHSPAAGVSPSTNSLSSKIGAVNSTTGRLVGKVAMLIVAKPTPSLSLVKRLRHHMAYSYKITSQ